MKLLDDKGRLFGKINIIDLSIVLFIIVALLGINYKLGLLKKLNTESQTVQKHIIRIWIKDIASYTVDEIKLEDIVQEQRSNIEIGKIVEKEVIPTRKTTSDLNGKWVISEVPERSDVIIKLETTSSSAVDNIKLGSIDAKVGASIILKGPKFQVESFIIGVE